MLAKARRFLRENGDDTVWRVCVASALGAPIVLVFLGLMQGEVLGALQVSLALELALAALYVLLCASNHLHGGTVMSEATTGRTGHTASAPADSVLTDRR